MPTLFQRRRRPFIPQGCDQQGRLRPTIQPKLTEAELDEHIASIYGQPEPAWLRWLTTGRFVGIYLVMLFGSVGLLAWLKWG